MSSETVEFVSVHPDRKRAPGLHGKPKHSPVINRIDQELRNAKNKSKIVLLVLAVEVDGLTDDDCRVSGYVLEVDKYDIKLRVTGTAVEREVWFKRSAIVTTEIVT